MPARRIAIDPARAMREGPLAIRAGAGVSADFEPEAQADAAAAWGAGSAGGERVDLPFETIDPPGSRDLDQAMQIERAVTATSSARRSPTSAPSSSRARRSTPPLTSAPSPSTRPSASGVPTRAAR